MTKYSSFPLHVQREIAAGHQAPIDGGDVRDRALAERGGRAREVREDVPLHVNTQEDRVEL